MKENLPSPTIYLILCLRFFILLSIFPATGLGQSAVSERQDYFVFNDMEKQHGKAKGERLAQQFYQFSSLQGDPDITLDELRMITARTLIVHGDTDFVPVAQAWEMYQHIAGAHLWIVPNGWHMPHIGPANEADFLRITPAFLKGDWNADIPGN